MRRLGTPSVLIDVTASSGLRTTAAGVALGGEQEEISSPNCTSNAGEGRYIEVFAGSACLFFALNPSHAVISDTNPDLIAFYETVARTPTEVYAIFVSLPRDPKTYYQIRSTFGRCQDAVTRAAHFLYLNRNCFNGITGRTQKENSMCLSLRPVSHGIRPCLR